MDVSIFEVVRAFNNTHSYAPVRLAKRLLGGLDNRTVSVLGLAYKAGISDTRDSPSLKLIEHLLSEVARIKAHDPNIQKLDREAIEFCSDLRSCLDGSDCCIIATREESFQQVSRHLSVMKNLAIVDMVRLLDPKVIGKKAQYVGVGLGPIPSA